MTNNARALGRWVSEPDWIKPAVHMPAFRMLPGEDREALTAFLGGLK
jgi:cytochrome c oxidase subunit 2